MAADPHEPLSAAANANQTLSDIVRGMQHAVNESQRMLEAHFLDVLNRYFHADRTPVMMRFQVDENQVVDAPLIALVHPNGLHLDELTLQFAIRVQGENVKPVSLPPEAEEQMKLLEQQLAAKEIERERPATELTRLEEMAASGRVRGEKEAKLKERIAELRMQIDQIDREIAALRGKLHLITRSSISVSIAPQSTTGDPATRRDSVIDVTMKFKAQPQPEGVSRIIDEFNKGIVPRRKSQPIDLEPDPPVTR